MTHVSLGRCLAALVLTFIWAGVAAAQPNTNSGSSPGKDPARPREIIPALRTRVDLAPLPQKPVLKDVLDFISERLTDRIGKKVQVVLDIRAFKAENPEVTSEQMHGEEVTFPDERRPLELGEILRLTLKQIPTNDATFLIRLGQVEVTTIYQANPAGLLSRKVAVAFHRRPLEEALEELSDLTGASIILDPRLGARSRAPVTAAFRNDTSLAAALRLLGDMTDVRVVIIQDALYATTPARAVSLLQEMGQLPARPVGPQRIPGAY
jgi:hypothetical protein